jgi:pimeloyl-ACP methyl ester carboxylesterase
MDERIELIVRLEDGRVLWTERWGPDTRPTALLIMGATSQGIRWPDGFCRVLVDRGLSVIRYDQRDTGRSTCGSYDASPYTLLDLARDAVAVLDAHTCASAHVVGMSMGGMIGQILALEHASRVRTLTSFASSPASMSVALAASGSPVTLDLPPPDRTAMDAIAALAPPVDDLDRVRYGVEMRRAIAGTYAPFDEAFFRDLEERCLARADHPDAAANHTRAVAATPDRMDRLANITVPTLVLHGTRDSLIPAGHGEATARLIPDARYVPIEGLSHELIPPVFELLADEVIGHAFAHP